MASQEEEPGSLWPPTHAVQESVAPVEKVFEGHASTPVLSALAFVPAPLVEQNAAPEEHVVQDEAPWLLKLGPSQAEQSSEAPVEKVLEGHTSKPVLSALAFVPAPLVEQNAAPEEEYSPAPAQASQDGAKNGALVPGLHREHTPLRGTDPGAHDWHEEEPGAVLNVPSSHGSHSSDPPTLYLPTTQVPHWWRDWSAYWPSPQYTHAFRTSSLLTQPSAWSHVEHTVAPGLLNLPSGQTLQDGGDEELSRNSPPEQRVHDTEPEAVLKEPVGHGKHKVELTVAEKFPRAH